MLYIIFGHDKRSYKLHNSIWEDPNGPNRQVENIIAEAKGPFRSVEEAGSAHNATQGTPAECRYDLESLAINRAFWSLIV